jgi:hypothetical protein
MVRRRLQDLANPAQQIEVWFGIAPFIPSVSILIDLENLREVPCKCVASAPARNLERGRKWCLSHELTRTDDLSTQNDEQITQHV